MREHVMLVLWILSAGCATLAIYPYTLYPLVLRMLPERQRRSEPVRSEEGSEFALLFCAYNEAAALQRKIINLVELRAVYPDLEILAYDDCSSDGTADILETAGLDIQVVRGLNRAGKAHGMKLLASRTERDFLIFTDANVELVPDGLNQLCTAYSDPSVGGVCGALEYFDSEGTATADVGGLYWRLEELIKSLESRSGNVMGADGSIFSIRKSLYPEFPDTVLDDLTVSMAVIFQGYRLIKEPRVVAKEELVASKKDDYRRRIRIATRAFHTHLWLRGSLRNMRISDRWRYWSHRYLRWHGAFLLSAACFSGLAALAIGGHSLVAVGFVAATLLAGLVGTFARVGPLSALVHIVISIYLTGAGVINAWRGQTMSTWRPPTR